MRVSLRPGNDAAIAVLMFCAYIEMESGRCGDVGSFKKNKKSGTK